MTKPTRALARHFSDLRLNDVPVSVQQEGKRLILDTIGCLVAGAKTEIGPLASSLGRLLGPGHEATVAGIDERQGLLGAIYANGRMANAMDLDETFPVGVHFGVGAVTTALALGEAHQLHGRDVLLALIAGYELGGRIASAIGPMVQVQNGTVTGYPSVWGVGAPVVAAAAGTTAKALAFDPDQFSQAIGLAISNAPLPVGAQWSSAVHLPNCKYCDAGWCALTGAFGALSAQHGSTGFTAVLDGDYGLTRMYGSNGAGNAYLTRELGDYWALSDISYKPWPSCRFTHYPLTALSRLLERLPMSPDEIDEIIVETSPLAESDRFTNGSPQTFASRQFSYPHLVAMMVLGVEPGPDWLDEAHSRDPKVERIKRRVRVESHPRGGDFAKEFERNQMRSLPGGIRIVTKGGEEAKEETDFALGDPWDEATRFGDAEIVRKFRHLVHHPRRETVIETIMALEQQPSLDPVLEVLRSPHHAT